MGCSASLEDHDNTACTVCFLGLDNAGKSQIVHKIISKDGTDYVPVPTAGVEYYDIPEASLRIYDVGGLGKYREMWTNFIRLSDGVVFVIDKSDYQRMTRVREEIKDVLEECKRLSIPILILANKTDKDTEKGLSNADIDSITQVSDFGIQNTIKQCSAVTGEGIADGKDWMLQHMRPHTQTVVQAVQ